MNWKDIFVNEAAHRDRCRLILESEAKQSLKSFSTCKNVHFCIGQSLRAHDKLISMVFHGAIDPGSVDQANICGTYPSYRTAVFMSYVRRCGS